VPLDGGRTFRGKRIFGDNKTWRGVVVMTGAAALLGGLQGALLGEWAARAGAAPFDYAAALRRLGLPAAAPGALASPEAFPAAYALFGALGGIGYALGELPNSFVKRRFDVAPGAKGAGALGTAFFVADQADSAIAALVLCALLFDITLRFFAVAVVTVALLHLAITSALFLARVKRAL
jgi:hypothetical protein